MYISKQDSSLWWKPKPEGFYFNVQGIEGQNDNSMPLFGNYYILPRDYHDLEPIYTALPEYLINQVKINNANGTLATKNTMCYLRGMVYSPNQAVNGDVSFSLQDKSGAIMVFNTKGSAGYTPKMGDTVKVRGMMLQSNGMSYIGVDSIYFLSQTGTPNPAPIVKILQENDESAHKKLTGVRLANPAQWDSTGKYSANGFYVYVKDTTNLNDSFSLWINRATDVYAMPVPTKAMNITGLVWQYDVTNPFTSGYFLSPRGSFDIEFINGSVGIDENNSGNIAKINVYPNPSIVGVWNFNLSDAQVINIQLVDGLGRTQSVGLNQTVTGQYQIDGKNLSQGIYYLQIIDNKGTVKGKSTLIKE
jgi:hypothetical protein